MVYTSRSTPRTSLSSATLSAREASDAEGGVNTTFAFATATSAAASASARLNARRIVERALSVRCTSSAKVERDDDDDIRCLRR
mmetsp:Transcript_324/g.918  ORF Transcript_324/g.918 Transcript_324/m.918 type:complete len:84 (-) Transcript_324:3404-3655(-)